jgi:hypothetical protein
MIAPPRALMIGRKLARELDHRAHVDVHHFKLLRGAGFRKVAVEAEPAVVDEKNLPCGASRPRKSRTSNRPVTT